MVSKSITSEIWLNTEQENLLQDLIAKLHYHRRWFNTPGNEAHIARLKYLLQIDPEDSTFNDLLDLYQDHNGMPLSPDYNPLSIRMMSVEEAIAENTVFRNLHAIEHNQYLLWTDDNSNVMGVYLYPPPLRGCVFFIDHEDWDDAPRFRSVKNFYASMVALMDQNAQSDEDDVRDWPGLETDYPKREIDPEHDLVDLAAAQFHADQYMREGDLDRRRARAYRAMNMLPVHAHKLLYMFLDDERDFFVQERAIEILALHKDAEAIPRIEEIIRTSETNPRIAGLVALGSIGTPAALDALLRLVRDFAWGRERGGYLHYIQGSMDEMGYETRFENTVFSYRRQGETDWTDLL